MSILDVLSNRAIARLATSILILEPWIGWHSWNATDFRDLVKWGIFGAPPKGQVQLDLFIKKSADRLR